jgi:hypothetical protein
MIINSAVREKGIGREGENGRRRERKGCSSQGIA